MATKKAATTRHSRQKLDFNQLKVFIMVHDSWKEQFGTVDFKKLAKQFPQVAERQLQLLAKGERRAEEVARIRKEIAACKPSEPKTTNQSNPMLEAVLS
jgi:hypothetical protein